MTNDSARYVARPFEIARRDDKREIVFATLPLWHNLGILDYCLFYLHLPTEIEMRLFLFKTP